MNGRSKAAPFHVTSTPGGNERNRRSSAASSTVSSPTKTSSPPGPHTATAMILDTRGSSPSVLVSVSMSSP
jgi:hypothetical protein